MTICDVCRKPRAKGERSPREYVLSLVPCDDSAPPADGGFLSTFEVCAPCRAKIVDEITEAVKRLVNPPQLASEPTDVPDVSVATERIERLD